MSVRPAGITTHTELIIRNFIVNLHHRKSRDRTGSEERQNKSTIMTWTCLLRLAEFGPSDTQSGVSSAHKTSAMGQSWCSGRIRCSFTDFDLLLLHRVYFTKNGGGAYYLRFTVLLQSREYLVTNNCLLWGRSRFLTRRKMASLSTFRHLE